MNEGMYKSIVLMGCKHCGKSTQGKLLAQKLGVDFFDTDDELARLKGKDVRTYYSENGFGGFAIAEEEACREIIKDASGKRIVVATGGGICDNPPALEALRECGIFVFLRLDLQYSINRILSKVQEPIPGVFKNLPAYVLNEGPTSMEQIEQILLKKYTERYRQYQMLADVIIDIKNAPIEENFKTLLDALEIK